MKKKKDFSFAVKKVLDSTINRKTKITSNVCNPHYTPKTFAQQMYNTGQRRARLPLELSSPLQMLPSIALISIVILGIIFPPTELAFFKSVFQTPTPWFEKIVEGYFFIIGLWSFTLITKDFTLKLWLQTIGVFVIQHLMLAIGYLRGLFG